jgi:hypothetical protein
MRPRPKNPSETRTNKDDGYTVTLLPPGNADFTTVAVEQHSQMCLDDTSLSTANGTVQQQYHCEGGSQQIWRFVPVRGVADTYTQDSRSRCAARRPAPRPGSWPS